MSDTKEWKEYMQNVIARSGMWKDWRKRWRVGQGEMKEASLWQGTDFLFPRWSDRFTGICCGSLVRVEVRQKFSGMILVDVSCGCNLLLFRSKVG